MIDLSIRIGSLELKNPVLTASGCFGVGREYSEIYDISSLGGIVTKTITLRPREGNLPPRIWETPAGMLNSIGLANPGVKSFIETEIPFLRDIECVRIVSVAGETIGEFVELVGEIAPLEEVDAIEINISCPNVEQGGLTFGTDPVVITELVGKLRPVTKKPLWVKLTPNVTNIVATGKAAVDAGADALCAINTLLGMAIDTDTRKPRLGNVTGGLSGPAILPVALVKVYELYREFPEIPIIGIGGIGSPTEAIAHMLAGASAVQVGSGLFSYPRLPLDIIESFEEYCDEQGFSSVREITGSLIIPEI